MKVFGKQVFKKKKIEELYDFAQHGLINSNSVGMMLNDLVVTIDETPEESEERLKKKTAAKNKPKVTPKELYKLESLNLPDMQLNCDPAYIEKESKLLDRKAKLIVKGDSPKIKYGKQEIASLADRLRNRKKYSMHKDFFSSFPYTTSDQINKVVEGYKNLQTNRVEEFVPDLPPEAIELMEEYNSHCREICGKNAVFYIIADKKDFQRQATKRDPVLLAQSPFGLVWQILGAWDEEMILLEEL